MVLVVGCRLIWRLILVIKGVADRYGRKGEEV